MSATRADDQLAGATASILPSTQSLRWQPLRSGLFNIFRYDYEEFRFANGRLILRGNNGSGKSRVLALQLPFLFDGEVQPHRLEPDGDSAKRAEWNLLMGKHESRLGYTWIEFARRLDSGECVYLTLGCGLQAAEGRGLTGKWFFITSQRIGEDLFLKMDNGAAIGRDRLIEAIGAHGEVYTKASTYRKAVDAALFKLGEHRYEALVNLLIQLRQPQLSRSLDEGRLSQALSEAMAPLPSGVVQDMAEAMRTLENERVELANFGKVKAGAEAFLGEYRRYAGMATARRAAAVRGGQRAYEAAVKSLRTAEQSRGDASVKIAALKATVEDLALQKRQTEAAVAALNASPEMRSAEVLRQLQQRAENLRQQADAAVEAYARKQVTAEQQLGRYLQTVERLAVAQSRAAKRAEVVASTIKDLGLAGRGSAYLAPLSAPLEPEALGATRQGLIGLLDKQRAGLKHLKMLQQLGAAAAGSERQARQALSDTQVHFDELGAERQRCEQRRSEEIANFLADTRGWLQSLGELATTPLTGLDEDLAAWCDLGTGVNPLAEAVSEALTLTLAELNARRLDLKVLESSLASQAALLLEERQDLLARGTTVPPAVYYRSSDRPIEGAPLWQLIDFQAEVPLQQQAGLEAALEAAGLLDAWVFPDGRLLAEGEHDAIIHPGLLQPAEVSLAGVLRPDSERQGSAAQVPDQVIAAVLQTISYGLDAAAYAAVDAAGAWRLGPLTGRWEKERSAYIGNSARAAAKSRRLAELQIQLTQLEDELERGRRQQRNINEQEYAARAEARRAPSDQIVRDLNAQLADCVGRSGRLRARLVALEQDLGAAIAKREEAVRQSQRSAEDLGLSLWRERLDELNELLGSLAHGLAELWPTLEAWYDAAASASEAAASRDEAAAEVSEQAVVRSEASANAAAVYAEWQTLQQTAGEAVESVLQRLAEARLQLQRIGQLDRQCLTDLLEQERRLGAAASDVERANEEVWQSTEMRGEAIQRFSALIGTRLHLTVDVELATIEAGPWSPTKAVELARSCELLLAGVAVEEEPWQRSQREILRRIQDLTNALLPLDYQPVADIEDGLHLVSVPYQGRDVTVSDLRELVDAEMQARGDLLGEREREILENHLIGDAALHLHDLLHRGDGWVREMNAELEQRPMSTGMKLRFAWRPLESASPTLLNARRSLLRIGSTWSPAEREGIGAFLQEQIQAQRLAHGERTWVEHLTAALDYRGWHQFYIERYQDGQWKRLTRRTHGTGSGGEKAIALTVPQFAAAAAHYRSADPYAPRLILLDEAFVGIDSDMRSKCMGLLATFDLDFVMTSEREWGCYPTVPALAICQLETRQGIEAIGVTRWVWNGVDRALSHEILPEAGAPKEAAL